MSVRPRSLLSGAPVAAVALTVGALLVAAAPASAAATGTVTGRVVDDAGAPVAGLAVSARTGANVVVGTTSTAADGSYRLAAKVGDRAICFDGRQVATASGGYSFTCFGGADAATATPVTVVAGSTRKGVSVTVTRRSVVTGRVTDTAGHPLTGVGIRLASNGAVVTTTAANGTYRLVFDPATTPRTSVCFEGATGTGGTSAAGYLDSCGGPFPLAPGGVRTVNRALPAGAGASGRVTDATGAAVANAEIRVFADAGPTVRTGADGTWRIEGLTPGPATLLATPPADASGPNASGLLARCYGGSAPEIGTCPQGAVFTLTTGRVTGGLGVTLPSAGALSGIVTDDAGTPIPGVEVLPTRTNDESDLFRTSVVSGADGRWRAIGLEPGTYTVCTPRFTNLPTAPDPDGYSGGCIVGSDNRLLNFDVTGGTTVVTPAFVLTGLGRVLGRVVEAATGRGVPGVEVAVGDAGQFVGDVNRVVTGPDGSYTFGALTVGDKGVCAFVPTGLGAQPPLGYSDSCPSSVGLFEPTLTVTVTQRGITTAPTIRLAENGTVAGRVVDAAGFALQNVRVEVVNTATEQNQFLTTDAQGRWATGPIGAGHLSVCFYDTADARRAVDGTRPAAGYVNECWNNRADPEPIVALQPGQRRTGVDATLAARTTG